MCHMVSHGVTCHPAEVTFPPSPVEAGTRWSDPGVDLVGLLHTKMYTHPHTVTHPNTIRARRRVTSFIRRTIPTTMPSFFDLLTSFGWTRAYLTYDKLQSLQNTAARLVTGARKFDHITPVMWELHCLPVQQRIKFKTAVLVFKCLHGLALAYLSEYCKLTTGRSHLRSANACLLSCSTHTDNLWWQEFAVCGPVVRNSSPVTLRSSEVTKQTFRRQLQTFLFNCLDN